MNAMNPTVADKAAKPTRRTILRWILFVSGMVLAVGLAGFVILSLRIGADVRATARTARKHHPGDDVSALIRYAEESTHSFQARNRAVWALGQLGDPRALPHLKQYYTGEPCDHEKGLCQRELGKAIELLEGGLNATALVWRH